MPHKLSAALERLAARHHELIEHLATLQTDLHAVEIENVHLRARIVFLEAQLRDALTELSERHA